MIQTLLLNGLELIDRFLVRDTRGAVGSAELVFSSSSSTLSPPLNCFCTTGNITIITYIDFTTNVVKIKNLSSVLSKQKQQNMNYPTKMRSCTTKMKIISTQEDGENHKTRPAILNISFHYGILKV